jgi:hypothetical protein
VQLYHKSTLFELISYVSGSRAKKKSSESRIRRYNSTLGHLLTEKKTGSYLRNRCSDLFSSKTIMRNKAEETIRKVAIKNM